MFPFFAFRFLLLHLIECMNINIYIMYKKLENNANKMKDRKISDAANAKTNLMAKIVFSDG